MKRKKGMYSISVVAQMFGVHQQTIRLYEKQGLITPQRSAGNTRQFTEEDVDALEQVIHLTHKMGINLAGVEMILKLQKKISRLQGEVNQLFDQTKDQLESETEVYKQQVESQVSQLLHIRQKNKSAPEQTLAKPGSSNEDRKNVDQHSSDDGSKTVDWEIDYEDSL